MTVYVDDWRQLATIGGVTGRWSHLTADDVDELHRFAAALGMRRAWFQAHPHDPLRHHYDVTDPWRQRAIALGAVAVTWRQAAAARRARRRRLRPVPAAGLRSGPMSCPPPESSPAAALAVLGAATLGESGGEPMHRRIRAAWAGATLAAPACPVRCTPGDNLAIHVAVTAAPAGAALVVDVGDEEGFGYWGEVLTTAAEARHIAGLVIDGGVRDVAALEAHGFPVFSSTVALRGAAKTAAGTVGVPVVVGGVTVGPGDFVVGDADGVTVVPARSLSAVLAAGRARAEKEEGLFTALRGGATTVELLGLDPGAVTVT